MRHKEVLCGSSFRKIAGLVTKFLIERRFEQIIGNSPALEAVLEQVERVAPTDSTVLDPGRNRHRQRTDRARDSQPQLAVRTPVRKVELRCHSAGSAGK